MDEKYISVDAAIEIIEEAQKLLCPVGRWGRYYASDREKYDELEEMIDKLNAIMPADVLDRKDVLQAITVGLIQAGMTIGGRVHQCIYDALPKGEGGC